MLEKYAPKLIDLKKQLKSVSSDEKMIMGQLDEEINGYSSSLINKKIYELKRISGKIVETRNDISQKILMNLENHSTPNEELFEQQEYLEMQILILEKAIQRKQEQNRQFSHSVERNFIDHPFISSTTPNESTLKLRRNQRVFSN